MKALLWILWLVFYTGELNAVHWPLRVSDNGRYITDSAGEPFFFLCDTAWQLTGKILDPEVKKNHTWATSPNQMRAYIDDCEEKGFSVIHFALLKEFSGMGPHMVTNPDDTFFARCVDYVDYAHEKGIAVNLIPAWMGSSGKKWAKVFEELSESEVKAFARYVASWFRDYPNVLYSMGGDCAAYLERNNELVVDMRDEAAWMGETFKEEDPDALCLYFSQGNAPSSKYFHSSEWCDLNFIEIKKPSSPRQYMDVVRDYHLDPVKPTYLGEFAYEYEYEGQRWPLIEAHIIRRSAYWSLLSGAFGYTYGRRGLWSFNHSAKGLGLDYLLYKPWEELMTCDKSPGRCHMTVLAETFKQLAWYRLVPNHYLPNHKKFIPDGEDGLETMEFVASAVADDGSFAMAYFPQRLEKNMNLGVLNGNEVDAYWVDPGNGRKLSILKSPFSSQWVVFMPPSQRNSAGDHDWLLVLKADE